MRSSCIFIIFIKYFWQKAYIISQILRMNSQNYAVFDQNFLSSPLLTQEIKKGFNQDVMWINDEKFSQFSWKEIFLNMKKYKGRCLYMIRNNSQILLKSIENIDFINLERLYLANNRINNIQSLALIRMPNLRILNFLNNKISNFKSLVKLSSFQLKELFIQNNFASQLQFISKMKVNNAFDMLNIEGDIAHLLQINCAQFVVKFQPQLKSLSILNQTRLRQERIYQMIKSKNNQIKLFQYKMYLQLLQGEPQ